MLTHSCVCAWMHYLLFFSRVHYSYPCLTQCNAVFWWLEDVMQVFVIAVPLVILHCTFNSSENVITMLPFPLPYPALFFFFLKRCESESSAYLNVHDSGRESSHEGGGNGLGCSSKPTSRLLNEFGNWLAVASAHPCPPAADVCRNRESPTHPSFHFHPSLLQELTRGANAAPKNLLCLLPSALSIETVSVLQVRFPICSISNISSVTLSLFPQSPPVGRWVWSPPPTHTFLSYVRCFMHYAEYVHPNKQIAEFPAQHVLSSNSLCGRSGIMRTTLPCSVDS